MVWLVAHMWLVLAGAALLGLLFGWSFRGILLKGKARQATVERDVVQTELEQAKAEIDSLYAAQRTSNGAAKTEPAVQKLTDDNLLRKELEERELKLKSLTAELGRSRKELEALRISANGAKTAAATALAGAGAAVTVTGSGDGEPRLDANLNETDASLEWRNRYLQSRVRTLEAQAEEQTAVTTVTTDGPDVDLGVEPAAVTGGGDEVPEQELARLRWRNRYLEGRVAYYEGGQEDVAGGDSNGSNGHGGLTTAGAAVMAGAAAIVTDGDDPAPVQDTAADAVLRAMEQAEADSIEAVQPEILKAPRGKTGDDLTIISGIGPKIQEVLHDMGVFHYDQIAGWTPENAAWVDQQLSFSGRIDREEWVEQAKTLITKAETN